MLVTNSEIHLLLDMEPRVGNYHNCNVHGSIKLLQYLSNVVHLFNVTRSKGSGPSWKYLMGLNRI